MAYRDWVVDDQPKDVAYRHVINILTGAVILLHAVSESNTEALMISSRVEGTRVRFKGLMSLNSAY